MFLLICALAFIGSNADVQFSLSATTTAVSISWTGLEDLPTRKVHFAVGEVGANFSWKSVENGFFDCGIADTTQTSTGSVTDDSCTIVPGVTYDYVILYTVGTTLNEVKGDFMLPPICDNHTCAEGSILTGLGQQCSDASCSSCCSTISATFSFPAGVWTWTMIHFYTSDLAKLMDTSLEEYYSETYGVNIRFSEFDFYVAICCGDVCSSDGYVQCDQDYTVTYNVLRDRAELAGQTPLSVTLGESEFETKFWSALASESGLNGDFYDLNSVLFGYYLEASLLPPSNGQDTGYVDFEYRVDHVRDNSVVTATTFVAPQSDSSEFTEERIKEIMNSEAKNGELYSWHTITFTNQDGVLTIDPAEDADGYQYVEGEFIDLPLNLPASRLLNVYSFINIENTDDVYNRDYTTWLTSPDGSAVDFDRLFEAINTQGGPYMARLGFIEQDIFRFFSGDNLHFWHGRSASEEVLLQNEGHGYGDYEWYLITPVTEDTTLGLSATASATERAEEVIRLVSLADTDSNICGIRVPQKDYMSASTARLNCPNFFNAGVDYFVHMVADNSNGEYIYYLKNSYESYNLFEPLVTALDIQTLSGQMQVTPFEFEYEMENAKSDGYVWWVITELEQAMDYVDIREGAHAINDCKTGADNNVDLESGVLFDGISSENAATGVLAIPQRNPITSISDGSCSLTYLGQNFKNEYKLHVSYDARQKTDAGVSLDFVVVGWSVNVHFYHLLWFTTVVVLDEQDPGNTCGSGELEVQHDQLNNYLDIERNFCPSMIPNGFVKTFTIDDSGQFNNQVCLFEEHVGCVTSQPNEFGPQVTTCTVTSDMTLEVRCEVLTPEPTNEPTNPPTKTPTNPPTKNPTVPPTNPPTNSPTNPPTLPPTLPPTNTPTSLPTLSPTTTFEPTNIPTRIPTDSPTLPPTNRPSELPSQSPTNSPTSHPTNSPSTNKPTTSPSRSPTVSPRTTAKPTNKPTLLPTTTVKPTPIPTPLPTPIPTPLPTRSCPDPYFQSEECCDCWFQLAHCREKRVTCLVNLYSGLEECAMKSTFGRRMLSVNGKSTTRPFDLNGEEQDDCARLSEEHKDIITKNNLNFEDFCHYGNAIYHKNKFTCIGYGEATKKCNNKETICVGLMNGRFNSYGKAQVQMEAVLHAIKNKENDLGVHSQCPSKIQQ